MSTIYFALHKYGNYQDNYYTSDMSTLISTLQANALITWSGNLGVTDGVRIINTFRGDFSNVNCGVVIRDNTTPSLYRIIKKQFIRKDMWSVTMVKDILSSRYNEVINSKVLVSRLGIPRDVYNPLLFVDEQMHLSEVKKKHETIDELINTKSYGYIMIWKRNSLDGTIVWHQTATPTRQYDISVANLNDLPIYDNGPVLMTSYRSVTSFDNVKTKLNSASVSKARDERFEYYKDNETEDMYSSANNVDYDSRTYKGFYISNKNSYDDVSIRNNAKLILEQKKINGSILSEPYDIYDGKVIFEQNTGKYYEVTKRTYGIIDYYEQVTKEEVADIYSSIASDVDETDYLNCRWNIEESQFEFKFDALPYIDQPINHTLQPYENTNDQPFQIIFTPIIEQGTFITDGTCYTSSRMLTEHMLYDLISEYSGENGKLIDVQLVPYSPIDGYANQWSGTQYTLDSSSVKESITFASSGQIIPLFQVSYTSFTKTILVSKTFDDYKLEQKNKYILTSPSGAGNYEFSVAKNGGLRGFNVKVDLRPYASYYCMQPLYEQLYGANYNDTRGLIWKEDSSLTLISNQWETYTRQNINYLNSFNAQQDYQRSTMKLQHEANWGNFGFDSSKRIVEATMGAVSGGIGTAAMGAALGVGTGGLAVGGALASVGGAVLGEAIEAGQLAYNNSMENRLLSNELNYGRQQFNYSLDNIKALPENVEKVSGIYGTNNLVPYLQTFEPTESEKQYYLSYLDTYGVNIGMMVDLKDLTFNYIQGTLLIYNGTITNEEYTELCTQMNKGARKYEV